MADDVFEDDPGVGTKSKATESPPFSVLRQVSRAFFGAGVWILGFVISFVAASAASASGIGVENVSLDGEGTFTFAGWIFSGAHMVSTQITQGGETVQSLNVASELGGISTAVILVVPILLFLAGRYLGSGGWGWTAGSSLVLGYLPMTAIGVVLFSKSGDVGLNTIRVGPATPGVYLLMGVAYPVVFGGLGAYFAD